jgi:hypothetical protein
VHAGHPVVVSTAACGRRLGGGPAHDSTRSDRVIQPSRVADDSAVAQPTMASSPPSSAPQNWPGLAATPHPTPELASHASLRAEQRACASLFHGTSPAHLKWLRPRTQNWLRILARYQGPPSRPAGDAHQGAHRGDRGLAPARPVRVPGRSSSINRGGTDGPSTRSAGSANGDPGRPSSRGESGPCSVVVLSSETIPEEPFTTPEGGIDMGSIRTP